MCGQGLFELSLGKTHVQHICMKENTETAATLPLFRQQKPQFAVKVAFGWMHNEGFFYFVAAGFAVWESAAFVSAHFGFGVASQIFKSSNQAFSPPLMNSKRSFSAAIASFSPKILMLASGT